MKGLNELTGQETVDETGYAGLAQDTPRGDYREMKAAFPLSTTALNAFHSFWMNCMKCWSDQWLPPAFVQSDAYPFKSSEALWKKMQWYGDTLVCGRIHDCDEDMDMVHETKQTIGAFVVCPCLLGWGLAGTAFYAAASAVSCPLTTCLDLTLFASGRCCAASAPSPETVEPYEDLQECCLIIRAPGAQNMY